jgi:signal transduction histidine kinase/CheY-like chemotaxis protein
VAALTAVTTLAGLKDFWVAAIGCVVLLLVAARAGCRQDLAVASVHEALASTLPAAAGEVPASAAAELEALKDEVCRLRAAEADLVAARQLAESAASAKGEFLATMSHEIRTPLNGIIPILELVLGTTLPGDVRAHVGAAFQSAKEMLRIVGDVLDFSKLEADSLQLEVASFKPRELVESVCNLLKRGADSKRVRLSWEIDPSVAPTLRGDALRLRQTLTNLISNAVKFTQHGEVRVAVSQVGEDRSHRTVRFSVSDTGIGIAPDAVERLFQPFSQADASTARTYGGTGLGLAICQRIVNAMGGAIGVQSTPGRGSTFWFTVPLLRAVGEAGMGGTDAHAILLTRDDALADLWSRHLGLVDIRFTRVTTTYEALSLLQVARPDSSSSGMPDLLLIDLGSAPKTAAAITRPVLREQHLAAVKILLLGEPSEHPEKTVNNRIHMASPELSSAAASQLLRAILQDAAEGIPVPPAPVVQICENYADQFEGLHVLLVDDIPINRFAGQRTLEKLGARVALAGGGREAIDLLENGSFDVVLMDCQMPDVDGFTATRVQRSREKQGKLPRVPILAVTANAMPGDREKCLEAGMDDHLAKPIQLAPLARLLSRWAQRAQAPRDVAYASGASDRRQPDPQQPVRAAGETHRPSEANAAAL